MTFDVGVGEVKALTREAQQKVSHVVMTQLTLNKNLW